MSASLFFAWLFNALVFAGALVNLVVFAGYDAGPLAIGIALACALAALVATVSSIVILARAKGDPQRLRRARRVAWVLPWLAVAGFALAVAGGLVAGLMGY